MKLIHSKPGVHRSATDDERLEEDWPDEEWEDGEPEEDVEWGLPLGAENWATGEPLVTVDYFDFAPEHKAAIADGVLTLDGAVPNDDPTKSRILVYDIGGDYGPHDPLALIAIATVQDQALRLETARSALAGPVRDAVQAALGARVQHRTRTKENPFEVFLNAE